MKCRAIHDGIGWGVIWTDENGRDRGRSWMPNEAAARLVESIPEMLGVLEDATTDKPCLCETPRGGDCWVCRASNIVVGHLERSLTGSGS